MAANRDAEVWAQQHEEQNTIQPNEVETEPLLRSQRPASSHQYQQLSKQLTTRNAFAVLVSIQIGSGIFASPAQVDSNVPSPGVALLIWVLGGLLSWAGAASFAELGAALPLNGGMQEYLRHVYGDTMAFLMAWIYIMAVKPSSMAIQSIIIAESIGSVSSTDLLAAWKLKSIAVLAFIAMVLLNSINTKITIKLSESFTLVKIMTVVLIVIDGFIAVIAHLIDPNSAISGSRDWYSKDWFENRPSVSEGRTIDWASISEWERFGHYSAAIYAGLWAYDGWDNVSVRVLRSIQYSYTARHYNDESDDDAKANVIGSEIRDPGRSLPKAIKLAMVVVLSSYELVNLSYYILLSWDTMSSSDAVAVAAARSIFGRPAGIIMTILVAVSCAGSITSNVFAVGRLTVAASQRHYLPSFLSKRGLPKLYRKQLVATAGSSSPHVSDCGPTNTEENNTPESKFDAPIYAHILTLVITLIYILTGSFRALLTFVGMAEWVFYVSTIIGLIILRRREPDLYRPYRPFLMLPIIFIVVGTLVIVRSAMFAPAQSGVLAALLIAGALISKFVGI